MKIRNNTSLWLAMSVSLAVIAIIFTICSILASGIQKQVPSTMEELWLEYPHSVYLYTANSGDRVRAISDLISQKQQKVVAVYGGMDGYHPVVILQED